MDADGTQEKHGSGQTRQSDSGGGAATDQHQEVKRKLEKMYSILKKQHLLGSRAFLRPYLLFNDMVKSWWNSS